MLPSNAKEAITLLQSAITTMERLVNYAETASWPAGSVTRAELLEYAETMRRYEVVTGRLDSLTDMGNALVAAAEER